MRQKAGDNSEQYQSKGDMTVNNIYESKSRLSELFFKLNAEFNADNQITDIIDELQTYDDDRDVIGLEEKLKQANKVHLFEDVSWFKQEYVKKLAKFQFYESAQKIHAIVLGAVLEKFWSNITPLIRENIEETALLKAISDKVIDPVYALIEKEGCEDIMGLSRNDVNGMVYYLTGKCHIKWK